MSDKKGINPMAGAEPDEADNPDTGPVDESPILYQFTMWSDGSIRRYASDMAFDANVAKAPDVKSMKLLQVISVLDSQILALLAENVAPAAADGELDQMMAQMRLEQADGPSATSIADQDNPDV